MSSPGRQIRLLQKEDQGVYECQLSTEPKISRTVNLTVISESEEGDDVG